MLKTSVLLLDQIDISHQLDKPSHGALRNDRRGDGFVVVKQGLEVGDRLVVSDVSPAKAGLLLNPVEDDALKKRLKLAAATSEVGQ